MRRIKIRCYEKSCKQIARVVYVTEQLNLDRRMVCVYLCVKHSKSHEPRVVDERKVHNCYLEPKGCRESLPGFQSSGYTACRFCTDPDRYMPKYEKHEDGYGVDWCYCAEINARELADVVRAIN